MSESLVREVEDFTTVSGPDYVVLLQIARMAQEKPHEENGRMVGARECFPSRGLLAKKCHTKEDALAKSLRRLAAAGLEVRVPIGRRADGSPLFARAGQRCTYRLPRLAPSPEDVPGSEGPEGGTSSGLRAEHLPGSARNNFRAEGGTSSGPKEKRNETEPKREHSAALTVRGDDREDAHDLEADAAFIEFYERTFPRRVGRTAARAAFMKAVKGGKDRAPVPASAILAGARRYATDPNLPEPRFIPHPATWLNHGRWEDDPEPARSSGYIADEVALARRYAAMEGPLA